MTDMARSPRELAQRLAEAEHAEHELRALIEILLRENEAVFASRSWRIGNALAGTLRFVLKLAGRGLPLPQHAGHAREIATAHLDVLERRRVLLERLQDRAEIDVALTLAAIACEDNATR